MLDLWGGQTMRTGGDDLGAALALLGVQPIWDPASNRVTGFEIVPAAKLDRPRIDVTLRISGLLRDIFPTQIAFFDEAVQRVAARDEPQGENPLRRQHGELRSSSAKRDGRAAWESTAYSARRMALMARASPSASTPATGKPPAIWRKAIWTHQAPPTPAKAKA